MRDAKTRNPEQPAPFVADLVAHGRACFVRRQWNDAFEALALADHSTTLAAEDLERLAWSAGLTARDEEMAAALERAYHARVEARECLLAARAAFWLGFRLLALGEVARAGGWLARAQHLVEREGKDCVERGYLLLPLAYRHLHAGEFDQAHDVAALAAQLGERFDEIDLIAFARNLQGRALLPQGRLDQGLALLDEAMVAAIAGELSPVVTGILYCSAIASCQRIYAFDRTREWTTALAKWCDAHPQLVMFLASCHVHRAEIMEVGGAWAEAVAEARRAVQRCLRDSEREVAGRAHYQEAEIHRLRGEFGHAETAYREASRLGIEPQPGLGLLRLAQGDLDAASRAMRRVVSAARDRLERVRYLPAHVEIMLAVGDLDEARAASRELDDTAGTFNTEVLAAIAAHARASVQLAEGNAHAALDPARRAFVIWQRLGAPYLAARVRVLLARACAVLNDAEAARLEMAAAREVFDALGARPDLAAIRSIGASLEHDANRPTDHPLAGRELQVLRLIASGKTNKAIARELSLSEKTVDRHVSNIFGKLDVCSRSAATAFAYEHQLV